MSYHIYTLKTTPLTKRPYDYLHCCRGLSKGECYLLGIHPTQGTSLCVYIHVFDIQRMLPRPDNMWNAIKSIMFDLLIAHHTYRSSRFKCDNNWVLNSYTGKNMKNSLHLYNRILLFYKFFVQIEYSEDSLLILQGCLTTIFEHHLSISWNAGRVKVKNKLLDKYKHYYAKPFWLRGQTGD